ncbi:hypothetical protein GUJ93_ZPchr0006g45035 [Zizania palustris]|uniref:Uncharacterized protein n=1 Tax=Zizania palustris TaxID=103762 RepID=A0A8J5STF0_ZIZPA|nr:hypothetical protein GUJ93_ZPchr0006g45035 [Zizania palustris]
MPDGASTGSGDGGSKEGIGVPRPPSRRVPASPCPETHFAQEDGTPPAPPLPRRIPLAAAAASSARALAPERQPHPPRLLS